MILLVFETKQFSFKDIPEKPEREMTDKINEVKVCIYYICIEDHIISSFYNIFSRFKNCLFVFDFEYRFHLCTF